MKASSKSEKIKSFNPDDIGIQSNNIFGLPFSEEEAEIILLPVPWDATTSYRRGTAKGPEAIFQASFQIDLAHPDNPDLWKQGIYMIEEPEYWRKENKETGKKSEKIIERLASGKELDKKHQDLLETVNETCDELRQWVQIETTELLKNGKKVGLVGGEHSIPLGYLESLAEFYGNFSILQVDAHADLRHAYEGFTYSHASIMSNALDIKQVKKLVQVGVRDFSNGEKALIEKNPRRIKTFFDSAIKAGLFEGATWKSICEEIIDSLTDKVYISFDIDGLKPSLCPHTGTPVPGGFESDEIFYLFSLLQQSGKKVIGFDVNEVAPNEWDAIVGARVLWRLCGLL